MATDLSEEGREQWFSKFGMCQIHQSPSICISDKFQVMLKLLVQEAYFENLWLGEKFIEKLRPSHTPPDQGASGLGNYLKLRNWVKDSKSPIQF